MSKKMLKLSLSSSIDRSDLLDTVSSYGYERVSMVIEPGTYAVRGSVVDVFPANQNQPIRCDFFGDSIDRLTSFRLDTQRSIRDIDDTVIYPIDDAFVRSLTFSTRMMNSEVMANIHDGDYVVHERYGIGVFSGFCRLQVGGSEGEYVLIQFKGSDKLYMPLDQIPLLHRYAGSEANPRLSGLYDGGWERTRRQAHRSLAILAADIYQMFKTRQRVKGFAFLPDTEQQLVFEQGFLYEETKDQLTAIHDVKRDMESNRPMDRLLCGDVGYGKTEVLLRAAVKAALNHKQVMVLVPTTILAEQHHKTFTERCRDLPIRIAVMSRLKKPKDNKVVCQKLVDHEVDIVIGTHRLLQKDIAFSDLGLVVVDEEQRFGVKHKERIKELAHHIDVLTASATPIPRTLYMSLTGAKAISQLTTPPDGRQPIQTLIHDYSPELITKAIETELARGGQVYFLHNHIEQLPTIQAQLEAWVPGLRVRIAHGQMPASDLDNVMVAFYRHDFDLLLCTTIIENGLDIQSANTIIINRADRLGLSQIHQIRGRVGRCAIQAYAYVLFPMADQLTEESKGRLQALKESVTYLRP